MQTNSNHMNLAETLIEEFKKELPYTGDSVEVLPFELVRKEVLTLGSYIEHLEEQLSRYQVLLYHTNPEKP